MADTPLEFGQWIDINDRHPDYWKDRYVIVYMPNAYQIIDVQTVYNGGNGKSSFAKGWNKDERPYEVTHWMPLPNPPRKEAGNG